jgi:hypothetical protein
MNVGTIGHIDQPTVRIVVAGYLTTLLRPMTAPPAESLTRLRGQRSGKGQRKANKSKRWN